MRTVQEPLFSGSLTSDGEIRSSGKQAESGAMYHELNDPIDVLVLFENGSLKPQRFRWKGHVHRVAQVTGRWKTEKGAYQVRHFALMDEEANFFQLAYDEHSGHWRITRVWVE
jgi:hypothetical protein